MHILALAVDYDGTIAENGSVTWETTEALASLKQTGRKLLLVTGRQLVDLKHACTILDIFDYVIAENGAVLHQPSGDRTRVVAPPPAYALIERLSTQNAIPVSVGQSIIATWHPHELAVMNAIHDLGLEHQIIFNKDAVMVLPANVNKASGLKLACRELDISLSSIAGCGDAENDHSFLSICGCSAAVANALPSLKQQVDVVLRGDHGKGVVEFIHRIIEEDDQMLPRHRRGIVAGTDRQGEIFHFLPDEIILVVGNSGCGKSSYLTLLTERMIERGHQYCLIDPEGDYLSLEGAGVIGRLDSPPGARETLSLLLHADINVVVNTMSVDKAGRKRLFAELMPSIRRLREVSGRPQWLVIDEAHYSLPALSKGEENTLLDKSGAIIATVDPGMIDLDVLSDVDTVVAMGATAKDLIVQVARLLDLPPPDDLPYLEAYEFIAWTISVAKADVALRILRRERPHQIHNRHIGKYLDGDVGQHRAFYFQGDDRFARNVRQFLQISAEVSDQSWLRHLTAGDYSAWFRNVIRDDTLADRASEIERDKTASAAESKSCIAALIRDRYATD